MEVISWFVNRLFIDFRLYWLVEMNIRNVFFYWSVFDYRSIWINNQIQSNGISAGPAARDVSFKRPHFILQNRKIPDFRIRISKLAYGSQYYTNFLMHMCCQQHWLTLHLKIIFGHVCAQCSNKKKNQWINRQMKLNEKKIEEKRFNAMETGESAVYWMNKPNHKVIYILRIP